MKNWFYRYGFENNPFDLAPDKDPELIEYQDIIDDLVYRIESSSMVFIEAAQGMGKTALLVQLIRRFEGHGRVIYYDCFELRKKVEIDELMKNSYGVVGRLFGKIPTGMIVLLDNANSLSRENAERIKFYFDQNYIRSVVFTGTSFKNADLPDSIKDRIGMHVISLRPLSEFGAIELVSARLGEQSLLVSDEAVKFIFSKSNKNTATFLNLCGKVFSSLLPKDGAITLEDAKKVLRHG